MKRSAWEDLGFLWAIVRRRRALLCVIAALSVLASAFDGISIGMLVPLLGDLQLVQTSQVMPALFGWPAALVASVAQEWRVHALLGLVVAAVAIKNVLFFLSIRSGLRFSSRLAAEVRRAAARRILRAGLELHDRSKPGDLMNRVGRDIDNLEVLIRMGVEFVVNALTLAALAGVLFALSWRLAVLALGLGIASVLCGLAYARRMTRLGEDDVAAGTAMTVAMHESLGAIRLIKSFSTEGRHVRELHRSIASASEASFRRTIWGFAIHPITDVAATIALAALFLASLWLNGGDTRLMLAQTLPFMFVLLRIVPLLKILNGQKADVFSRWPYLRLVAGLLCGDDERAIEDGDEPFRGLAREIRLDGVTFAYRGRPKPALSAIDLVIPAGRTTAIIGESGSGKSTLANLLLRLYDPQQGSITIDGQPLKSLRLESYHRRLGSVGQDTFLFHQSVRFNIAYAAASPPSDERVIAAAKRARAHDFIMELPNGYDTTIGDRGVCLSGGQRQRLALARAIVIDPGILILDEATSALDAETERAIQEALREFGQGRTVIVIAHRASTIQDADQIVVLKNGRVVEVRHARPSVV